MWERFNERARRVIVMAQEEATRLGHSYVGTEHFLLGLMKDKSNLAVKTLISLDVNLEHVKTAIEGVMVKGDRSRVQDKVFTPRAKKVLEYAFDETRSWGHEYIGTEHLLLGVLREEDGVAARNLDSMGIRIETTRKMVAHLIGAEPSQIPYHTVPHSVPEWEKFNENVKNVVLQATQEATRSGSPEIRPEHILLGFLRETPNVAVKLLTGLGVDIASFRRNLEDLIPKEQNVLTEITPFSTETLRVFQFAYNPVRSRYTIGTDHLLLGLLKAAQEPKPTGVDLQSLFSNYQITYEKVVESIP